MSVSNNFDKIYLTYLLNNKQNRLKHNLKVFIEKVNYLLLRSIKLEALNTIYLVNTNKCFQINFKTSLWNRTNWGVENWSEDGNEERGGRHNQRPDESP